jgi:hypothetical protein
MGNFFRTALRLRGDFDRADNELFCSFAHKRHGPLANIKYPASIKYLSLPQITLSKLHLSSRASACIICPHRSSL